MHLVLGAALQEIALSTLPVTFLAELGFAVAFGVLLDTIVVRSVLVTALNLDLGRWVWWPSQLARQPRSLGQRRRQVARGELRQGVEQLDAGVDALQQVTGRRFDRRQSPELATAAGRIEHGDYGAEVGVQRADVGTC